MAIDRELLDALRWGAAERFELEDSFLDHKVFVYVETLHELLLAERVIGVGRDDVELSDEILAALRDEAREHAAHVVDTYNRDLEGFLERNALLPRERLLETYEAWATDRADNRAELVAVTEAYSAAADATLAFYAANAAEEASYDFGGHGDAEPKCGTCAALLETSPHPHSRVVEIGTPHPGCRQSWHRSGGDELPAELELPTAPAGVVGRQSIVIREGGHDQAADAIRSLAGEGP